jgi:hypothetical protein
MKILKWKKPVCDSDKQKHALTLQTELSYTTNHQNFKKHGMAQNHQCAMTAMGPKQPEDLGEQ